MQKEFLSLYENLGENIIKQKIHFFFFFFCLLQVYPEERPQRKVKNPGRCSYLNVMMKSSVCL